MASQTPGNNDSTSAKKTRKDRRSKSKKSSAGKGRKILGLFSRSSLIIALEALAVVCVIVGLAGGALLWRLTQGPVNLDFAQDYIERSLNSEDSPYRVDFGEVYLNWTNPAQPFRLDIRNFKIYSGKDQIFATRNIDVILSRRYLLVGQVAPKKVIISSPVLKVIRTRGQKIRLDIREEEESARPEASELEEDTSFAKDMLRIISGENSASPFSRLRELRIEKARFIVEDRFLNFSWMIPESYLTFSRGRQGATVKGLLHLPDNQGRARVDFDASISADLSRSNFAAELHDLSIETLAGKFFPDKALIRQKIPVSARMNASFGPELDLRSMSFSAQSPEGALFIPGLYKNRLSYNDLQMDLSYSGEERRIELEKLSAMFSGLGVRTNSRLEIKDGFLRGPVRLAIDKTTIAAVREIFPDQLEDEDVRLWIFEKIQQADIENLDLSALLAIPFRTSENEEEIQEDTIKDLTLSFDFEELDLDYASPFLPVTKAAGSFNMTGQTISLDGRAGKLGSLAIDNADINITKVFTRNAGKVDIKGALSGDLRGVIDYIEVERLASRINYDFHPQKIKGQVELDLDVSIPTGDDIQFDSVRYDIKGRVRNGFWPDAFAGMPLSGGPFDIRVSQDDIELNGQGFIGGAQTLQIEWHEYFSSPPKEADYTGRIEGRIITTPSFRENIGLGLEDFISGALPANFKYLASEDESAQADVSLEIGEAQIVIPQIGFEKNTNAQGNLDLQAEFQSGNLNTVSQITASSSDIAIKSGQLSFVRHNGEPRLTSGAFSGLVLGENEIDNLEFQITPSDIFKLEAKGSFLDGRWFIGKGEEKLERDLSPSGAADAKTSQGEQDSLLPPEKIASLRFDRIRTDPGRLIEDVALYVQTDNEADISQLEMDGRAGQGKIYLRFKPDESGKKFFRLELGDTGAALKAFDLYDNMEGGKATILAEPAENTEKGNFEGQLAIKKFRVRQAPVLAKLISSLSLSGLTQLFENKGIQFSALSSEFDWNYQDAGAKIELKKGRTAGNSLGLTFKGFINLATDKVDVTGTIVPLSGINSFISNIPLIGDIIGGGTGGGVFAAIYNIKGGFEDPKVTVNPLAVLAPGFLREMLFLSNADETDEIEVPESDLPVLPDLPETENQKGQEDPDKKSRKGAQ